MADPDSARPRSRVTPRRREEPAAAAPPGDEVTLPRRVDRVGRGPVTGALAPFAGVLAVGVLILAILVVALAIAVVGGRQPDLVATTDPFTVERFAGEDGSSLGRLYSGGEWETIGEWEVVAGAAHLTALPDGADRGFALLPGSSGRARIAATIVGVADDSGIVARYTGPDDYVALLPLTQAGSWRVVVVAGGEEVSSDAVGLVGADVGTRIELVVRGGTAWAIVDGQVVGTYAIKEAPAEGRVGLVAGLASGASGRFDDVGRERG